LSERCFQIGSLHFVRMEELPSASVTQLKRLNVFICIKPNVNYFQTTNEFQNFPNDWINATNRFKEPERSIRMKELKKFFPKEIK